MIKHILIVVGCLALLTGAVSAQEVVIQNFPLGVAGSVDMKIFEPYLPQLQVIADSLQQNRLLKAVVTGGADGQRYERSHDAKNPSLALGRAHLLRTVLMTEFGVDSMQIYLRSEEVKEIGPQYRFASVKLERDLSSMEIYVDTCLNNISARLDTLANRPPVEKHFTEIKEVPIIEEEDEDLGILFGVGATTSPFGGIPIVTAAFTYKRVVCVEGVVGHTWWSGETFAFEGQDLSTRRRQIGGHTIIYPWETVPVGFVGGWLRTEEIAQEYYEYSKLSEGVVLGVRVTPIKHVSVTGAYNPSKHRIATESFSTSENDQFLLYVTAQMGIGGAK